MSNQDQPKPTPTKHRFRDHHIPVTDEQRAFAHKIAAQLTETKPEAIRQIEAIVGYLGVEYAQAMFEQTLDIEAHGGMMIISGKRRRTPGGVFLYIISQRLTIEERKKLMYRFQGKKKKKPASKDGAKTAAAQAKPQHEPKVRFPPPPWDWYHSLFNELVEASGAASTVKITLIGRPGAIQIQNETVLTAMTSTPRGSSLPKGIPMPPQVPTLYTVYLALKQWRKVETSLENPEDLIIIEGTCGFDPEMQGMVIYATNVTTKLLEAGKREPKAPKNPPPQQDGQPVNPPAPRPQHTPPVVAAPAVPAVPRFPIPPNAPPEAAKKLQELHLAAEQFRQKLATLEKNPPEQRPGYAMTQKLLKNTEDQIAALEKRFQ